MAHFSAITTFHSLSLPHQRRAFYMSFALPVGCHRNINLLNEEHVFTYRSCVNMMFGEIGILTDRNRTPRAGDRLLLNTGIVFRGCFHFWLNTVFCESCRGNDYRTLLQVCVFDLGRWVGERGGYSLLTRVSTKYLGVRPRAENNV